MPENWSYWQAQKPRYLFLFFFYVIILTRSSTAKHELIRLFSGTHIIVYPTSTVVSLFAYISVRTTLRYQVITGVLHVFCVCERFSAPRHDGLSTIIDNGKCVDVVFCPSGHFSRVKCISLELLTRAQVHGRYYFDLFVLNFGRQRIGLMRPFLFDV